MAVIKIQSTIRLKPEVHAKLRKIAKVETRTITNMIEHLINKKISDYEKINGEIKLTEEDIWGKSPQ